MAPFERGGNGLVRRRARIQTRLVWLQTGYIHFYVTALNLIHFNKNLLSDYLVLGTVQVSWGCVRE